MFTLRLLGSTSLDGPDGPVTGRAAMRQRIALLALLAVEHPRPISRDKLVAYLWPESGTDEARHQLRDSLYILRSALGDDSILSAGDDLRLNSDRLACDLWGFEAALQRDDPEAAVSAYKGPFLSGFHLSDSQEFEPWAERERSRLARLYGQALEQLAERATRKGDAVRSVEWWSRLASEDLFNSRIALRYMQALEAAGDRAGALRHANAHSELLRTELGAVPEREVVALADRLRLESRPGAVAESAEAQSTWAVSDSIRQTTGAARPTRRNWLPVTALVVGALLGVGVLGGWLLRNRATKLTPDRVAVAVFENRTGQPDLNDLGPMTADWIIRGLMETPLIDVTDVEAVYAGEPHDSSEWIEPRALARRNGAGLVISGSYYRSGDSVLFQAGITDVASGRVLRAFAPIAVPLEKPVGALEGLRDAIAGGLGALVNPANQYFPVDPDLIPPPNYAAYREFIAGLRAGKLGDSDAELRHYRRAAALDSSFVAPLVQLAYQAMRGDQCDLTDSIATALEPRRERLTPWNRITIDLLDARCRGDMARAVELLGQRLEAYPRSLTAKRQYSAALQSANEPKDAQKILNRLDPELDPTGRFSRDQTRVGYWWYMAASHHMLGHYLEEVEVTNRWRDSTNPEWLTIRGRALSALGREGEVLDLVKGMSAAPIDAAAEAGLPIATELEVHGHHAAAAAVAESILARLERGPVAGSNRAQSVAWANRLLGRIDRERAALDEIARTEFDTLTRLEAEGRIAVLLSDTAEASRIDSLLAEQSNRSLRTPTIRAGLILARAHIAAGFGRREQAVALLRDASARGMIPLGSSYSFHNDLLLAPLRGYAPFETLLKPDN